MVKHVWVRHGGIAPLPVYPGAEAPRSEIHLCNRCSQIVFSEVGGNPMEETNPSLKECNISIVEHVMET